MYEKREHPRTPIDADIICEIDGESYQALAKDISLGGMFIEADFVPPFGAKMQIVCRLPGMQSDSSLPAVVRWVKPGGFGIQFGLLGARETHAITSLLGRRS
ncbi:MAG TPA: PilZ domain-containing protein [Polyangiaceae bacterium]|nr:PilZ domain-containing protein [Polyangiaceae bacterium]